MVREFGLCERIEKAIQDMTVWQAQMFHVGLILMLPKDFLP